MVFKKELSVIIPAYNEAERIAGTLKAVSEYLSARGYSFEILVLNDGSFDSTAQRTREVAALYSNIQLIDHKENRGKGEVVKEGIGRVAFPYCLFMDADNSTSIMEWEKFEKFFENGFKVVTASRHLQGSVILKPQPWQRRILGRGYRWITRKLFHLKCSDFNCGFKAYETPIAKRIYHSVQMKDWTFDVEAFCLMKKWDIAFAEVPVSWAHHSKGSQLSGWRLLKTVWKSLCSLLRLKKIYVKKKSGWRNSASAIWIVVIFLLYVCWVILPKMKGRF